MNDIERSQKIARLIAKAREAAPLTRAAWTKLCSDVDAVAAKAVSPEMLHEVSGQALLWLEPGGAFEDPSYAKKRRPKTP